MDTIKISIIFFIASVIFLFTACEKSYDTISDEDCDTYGYGDCITLAPIEAELKLNFSINKNRQWVAFEIYEGTIDQEKIIVYDTSWNSELTYVMAIPQTYTVKAYYSVSGKTIFAIDGMEMKAKSVQKCDSLCWLLREFRLDLMLK